LPGVFEALHRLSQKGYEFIIVTNQAGVGTGLMSYHALESIHDQMRKELRENGTEILDIYACTDAFDSGSKRRKPHPTMFFEARDKHQIDLAECYYVGDDPRDVLAAYNAGMKSIYVGDPLRLEELPLEKSPTFVAHSLLEASKFLN
ncbi:MAG: HAD-IIIA family hydrolase, partial [Bdellovibrionales bacterium]|nr:HAD-IIIA family hydrolase [Bdellovibrionales bacterium]